MNDMNCICQLRSAEMLGAITLNILRIKYFSLFDLIQYILFSQTLSLIQEN